MEPESPHLQQQTNKIFSDLPIHSEFQTPMVQTTPLQHTQMEQMFNAMSNVLMQVNHTNQTLVSYLSNSGTVQTMAQDRPDPKVRPKSFSGLPSEDVLMWLDHFENVASYHQWSENRKALKACALFDNGATTWFIQQDSSLKEDCPN